MFVKRLAASFTLLLIVISSAAPQSLDLQNDLKKDEQKLKEEREKKALELLDETIKESRSLVIAENRVRIQVEAADLLWARDEKRARELFKECIASLNEIARSVIPVTERADAISFGENASFQQAPSNSYLITLAASQLRQEILQALLKRDIKWAREFLRASRLSAGSAEANSWMQNYDVVMDIQLANEIVETDPKQAFELVQENLDSAFSAGQSDNLINIIKKLQTRDSDAATRLAEGLMKKFRSENVSGNRGVLILAMNFLAAASPQNNGASAEKQPALKKAAPLLNEQSLKDLTEMLAAAAMKDRSDSDEAEDGYSNVNLMALQSVMPQIEKYAPSRAPALRAKINEFNKALDPRSRAYSELVSKGNDATVEDMVNAASKMPSGDGEPFYAQAVRMAIEKGEVERARQIVNEKIKSEDDRKSLIAEIDRQTLTSSAVQGKREEVRQMLARVESPEDRAMILIQLTTALSERGDKKGALQLIGEARGLLGFRPETSMQFGMLIELARAAAAIDPAQGFELLEGMIEQFNLLAAASAAIDAFEGRQQFREGEMFLRGSSIIGNAAQSWSDSMQTLARSDFDRARISVARFQRIELRLMIQLAIVKSVLADKSGAKDNPGRRLDNLFKNRAAMK
jgi:hypothetical protein